MGGPCYGGTLLSIETLLMKFLKNNLMDNKTEFVWTDTLITEFILRNCNKLHEWDEGGVQEYLNDFKGQKEQPIQEEPIKVGNLERTTHFGGYYFASKELTDEWVKMINDSIQDTISQISKPLPTKEEVSNSWEIQSFKNVDNGIFFTRYEDGYFKAQPHHGGNQESWMLSASHMAITSVKRLSDNQILAAMEGNYGSTERTDGYPNKPIKKFFISEGLMYAQFDEGCGRNDGCLPISSIKKIIKQESKPILTTEDGFVVYDPAAWIYVVDNNLRRWVTNAISCVPDKSNKYFHVLGNCVKYIEENKPTLCKDKPLLEEAIRKVINSYSIENRSDTPDYILAQYLANCLMAYEKAVTSRDCKQI